MKSYRAKFEVIRSLRRRDDVHAFADPLMVISGKLQVFDPESTRRPTRIGSVQAAVVSFKGPDVYGRLDDQGVIDTDHFVGTFLDMAVGGLRREIVADANLSDVVGRILLIREPHLEPKHRKRGLGLALVWQLIRTFGGGCELAVYRILPGDGEPDGAQLGSIGMKLLKGTEYLGLHPPQLRKMPPFKQRA